MINLISSFPRSGNTWLRLIITELLLIKENQNYKTYDLLDMISKYVPDLHCDDMKSNHNLQNRFLKSHNKFTDIDVNYDQCILLFRKPEDCILSYYYFKEARGELSSFYLSNKDEFAKTFTHKWVDFHNSYIDNSPSFFTISYEDLLTEPTITLINFFSNLNIPASVNEINKVIQKTEFSNFKGKWTLNDTQNPNHSFFRNGATGGGENEFSKECLHYIRKISDEVVMKLLQKHNPK